MIEPLFILHSKMNSILNKEIFANVCLDCILDERFYCIQYGIVFHAPNIIKIIYISFLSDRENLSTMAQKPISQSVMTRLHTSRPSALESGDKA